MAHKRVGMIAAILATATTAMTVGTRVFADQGHGYETMHGWESGWHGWLIGPMMMTAFLIIAVIAIVLVVRWLAPSVDPRSGPASEKSPLDILRERFARGEIDQAEFDDRRQALGG